MKKETIYYVYSIYAFWPHRDEAHSFYFKDKKSAEEVRDKIFKNSNKLGRNHLAYCSHVSIPTETAINEERLHKVYKSASDFFNSCTIYKNIYEQFSQEAALEI